MAKFQSTPPARGATARTPAGSPRRLDFNPRPPRGGRPFCSISLTLSAHFNPRPPRVGRPLRLDPSDGDNMLFQSTPPARGATMGGNGSARRVMISIHAPREGGDFVILAAPFAPRYFNPRPPRGGRRRRRRVTRGTPCNFNPRPPRGGRLLRFAKPDGTGDFNPRPPRGGRQPLTSLPLRMVISFQSTPPARGATALWDSTAPTVYLFQSTPPARGATAKMHSFTCGSLTNK